MTSRFHQPIWYMISESLIVKYEAHHSSQKFTGSGLVFCVHYPTNPRIVQPEVIPDFLHAIGSTFVCLDNRRVSIAVPLLIIRQRLCHLPSLRCAKITATKGKKHDLIPVMLAPPAHGS